ncbi:hypothetical protein [Paenibacillus koleovorans]|uniref:hypothetical protein n=1 Tax=Paenibacillus koleovorans TaxID=121608 RepID=UPI000FD85137|nr:hypothetical protein [Paenibacillus koleovorans]
MSLVSQLSSRTGDRTEESNRLVAQACLAEPALLEELAEALTGKDAALLGDCAEVFTKVAEAKPELSLPYFERLVPLLAHKTTRVRWEAMHAIALLAEHAPTERMLALVPQLAGLLCADGSTIVRDYAVDALGGMAKAGEASAQAAYPVLVEALSVWDGKHLGRALTALSRVVVSAPGMAIEALQYGYDYADHSKGVVKKAAKALIKAAER